MSLDQLDFTKFPLWLREGPWTWEAKGTLAVVSLGLVLSFPKALDAFVVEDGLEEVNWAYGGGAAFLVGVLAYMGKNIGYGPLVSFTMMSWCLTTMRYMLGIFGGSYASRVLASLLRFPSVAQHTVVVTIWWLVLVPLLGATMDKRGRRNFAKFNTRPFLLSVHLLDLPLAAADACYFHPRRLNFADFWAAALVAFTYVLFYLLFLDPQGLHFYIILSPRTRFTPIVYGSILLYYYAIFHFWDAVAARRLAHLQ